MLQLIANGVAKPVVRAVLAPLALSFVLLQSVSAIGQTPDDATVDRLLEVTESRKLSDSMLQQVDGMLQPMFERATNFKSLTPQQRQDAERFFAKFREKANAIMADELSWDRMKQLSAKIYKDTFTQKEVQDLITFYESPTGKAFVQKMPIVMQKSLNIMQERFVPLSEKMQRAAEEAAREFKANKK